MTGIATLNITSDVNNLAAVRRFVEEAGDRFGCDSEDVADMVLAMNEAVTNIMVHGYKDRPGDIVIDVWQRNSDFVVRLGDRASPFDPTTRPDPDITLPLELRPYGGMGVFMMRQLLDGLTYRPLNGGGNELTMVKIGVCEIRDT